MKRRKDNIFPIEWEGSEIEDIITISFHNSIFIEDFGVFKKGEEISFMTVDIDEGVLYELDEDGERARAQFFKCVPTE